MGGHVRAHGRLAEWLSIGRRFKKKHDRSKLFRDSGIKCFIKIPSQFSKGGTDEGAWRLLPRAGCGESLSACFTGPCALGLRAECGSTTICSGAKEKSW